MWIHTLGGLAGELLPFSPPLPPGAGPSHSSLRAAWGGAPGPWPWLSAHTPSEGSGRRAFSTNKAPTRSSVAKWNVRICLDAPCKPRGYCDLWDSGRTDSPS